MKRLLIVLGVLILTFSIPAYTLAESDKSVEQGKDSKSEKKDKKKSKKKKRNPAREKESLEKCVDKTMVDAQKIIHKYKYKCELVNYAGEDYTSIYEAYSDEEKEHYVVLEVTGIDTDKRTVIMSIDTKQNIEARKQEAAEQERLEQERKAEEAKKKAEEEERQRKQANLQLTVYLTPKGTRYHFDTHCRYFTKVGRELTQEQALKEGYTHCSECGYWALLP